MLLPFDQFYISISKQYKKSKCRNLTPTLFHGMLSQSERKAHHYTST